MWDVTSPDPRLLVWLKVRLEHFFLGSPLWWTNLQLVMLAEPSCVSAAVSLCSCLTVGVPVASSESAMYICAGAAQHDGGAAALEPEAEVPAGASAA